MSSSGRAAIPVARLREVGVTIDGARLLDEVSVEVERRRHLAVLGPNGSGKTTLLRVLATYRYPSTGDAEVVGATFGRSDLRAVRARVALVSTGLDPLLSPAAPAAALVAAAMRGATLPVAADRTPAARQAALTALARVGAGHLADRRIDTLSQGERQRVRIARALVGTPALLLLDEPFAGLDLGGREDLLADLDRLLAEPDGPTVVLVTHHLEELPTGIVDGMLLREGRVLAAGTIEQVLRDETVSRAFGLPVHIEVSSGRFTARRGIRA